MTAGAVPLDRLMERLAAEFSALEVMGGRVEAMVGDLVARAEGPIPPELQELDLLIQSVRDLAAFTAALSGTAPEVEIDPAPGLAALKLQRLRDALGPFPCDPA